MTMVVGNVGSLRKVPDEPFEWHRDTDSVVYRVHNEKDNILNSLRFAVTLALLFESKLQ